MSECQNQNCNIFQFLSSSSFFYSLRSQTGLFFFFSSIPRPGPPGLSQLFRCQIQVRKVKMLPPFGFSHRFFYSTGMEMSSWGQACGFFSGGLFYSTWICHVCSYLRNSPPNWIRTATELRLPGMLIQTPSSYKRHLSSIICVFPCTINGWKDAGGVQNRPSDTTFWDDKSTFDFLCGRVFVVAVNISVIQKAGSVAAQLGVWRFSLSSCKLLRFLI